MKFTYDAYRGLIALLRENGYGICGYHENHEGRRCAILRHDVDTSIYQALKMAELEAEEGVSSTYFVLLKTDFYNPASPNAGRMLRRIGELGHEIGLHFDELAYPDTDKMVQKIREEADILADICHMPIRAISMHRPSKETLESNYDIPGLVNSYGDTFFRGFKYLSDSRHHWREPVEDIIRQGEHERLHILTHPFWYHETEQDMRSCLMEFINSARAERYEYLTDNIRDLGSVIARDEI